LEQIEEELRRVRNMRGNPKQVFLGDGNAFGIETPSLLLILERIFHWFLNCQMVNMDATVTDIRNKTDKELRQLKKAGVRRLYLGIEGGLDDVLTFVQKGHNIEQVYRGSWGECVDSSFSALYSQGFTDVHQHIRPTAQF
jgi:radical SAM superfamily enzyme YgiQ (UPF0313 family)